MKEVFLTRTAAEWERVFGEGLFPGAPQRWLREWIADDHARAGGLMIEVDDPAGADGLATGERRSQADSASRMR